MTCKQMLRLLTYLKLAWKYILYIYKTTVCEKELTREDKIMTAIQGPNNEPNKPIAGGQAQANLFAKQQGTSIFAEKNIDNSINTAFKEAWADFKNGFRC